MHTDHQDESECCDSGDEGNTLFSQVNQRPNLNFRPANTSLSVAPTNQSNLMVGHTATISPSHSYDPLA